MFALSSSSGRVSMRHGHGHVPGATGDYRTEFHAKAAAVADELIGGEHDFVFLHVKAVDDTGHDRHPAQKVADR